MDELEHEMARLQLLWLRVLAAAVGDALAVDEHHVDRRWIYSSSCRWICEVVELDHGRFGRAFEQLAARGARRVTTFGVNVAGSSEFSGSTRSRQAGRRRAIAQSGRSTEGDRSGSRSCPAPQS